MFFLLNNVKHLLIISKSRRNRKPRLRRFRLHQLAVMLENHLRRISGFQRNFGDILCLRHAVGNEGVPQRIVFPRERRPPLIRRRFRARRHVALLFPASPRSLDAISLIR